MKTHKVFIGLFAFTVSYSSLASPSLKYQANEKIDLTCDESDPKAMMTLYLPEAAHSIKTCNFSNPSFLRRYKNVLTLEISGGDKVIDLSKFPNKLKVRELDINFASLKSAQSLSKISDLEKLSFSHCSGISQLNFLSKLESLNELSITSDH